MKKTTLIALVAHDNEKCELVKCNGTSLIKHDFISTSTTGRLAEEDLHARPFG
jgi:methylglyoxal synthase